MSFYSLYLRIYYFLYMFTVTLWHYVQSICEIYASTRIEKPTRSEVIYWTETLDDILEQGDIYGYWNKFCCCRLLSIAQTRNMARICPLNYNLNFVIYRLIKISYKYFIVLVKRVYRKIVIILEFIWQSVLFM